MWDMSVSRPSTTGCSLEETTQVASSFDPPVWRGSHTRSLGRLLFYLVPEAVSYLVKANFTVKLLHIAIS